MAAIRLTNDNRSVIVRRAVAHGFDKQEAALLKEERTLAQEVYDFVYPAKVQKQMEALPKGFLPEEGQVTIYVGGQQHALKLEKARRMSKAMCGYYGDDRIAVLDTDPLGAKVVQFARKEATHKADRKEATNQARAVCASVKTLHRLIEVWPEVESFTGDIAANGKAVTALAVPIKVLNKTLGLPPDAKKSA